jgi:cyclophilin family peptidyl-prolyl cis-trans isomerase
VPKATKRERQRQNREARRRAMLAMQRRRKRLRTARNLGLVLLPIVVIFAVIQLTSGGSSSSAVQCDTTVPAKASPQTFSSPPPMTIDPTKQYTAVLKTSCGTITINLDAKTAPQSVNSFVALANQGFYNGTTFHRIVTDFVDQGGDPTGTGTGGPGYTLPDEPPTTAYTAGSVALANSGPGTSGSQFFIAVTKKGAKTLSAGGPPFKYSYLGQTDAAGLKVARKINTFGEKSEAGKPTRDIYVFTATAAEAGTTPSTTAPTSTTTKP